MNSRAQAAQIITEVIRNKRSLATLMSITTDNQRDYRLIQELSYGTLRWYYRLDGIARQLLQKPLRQQDFDVYAVILIGLYQLIYLRVPAHAAISESVSAVKMLNKTWAAKLTNAVLRNFQRNATTLEQSIDNKPSQRWSCPSWLFDKLQQAWPDHWQTILSTYNQPPSLVIRINPHKITREKYLTLLKEQDITAHPTCFSEQGILLEKNQFRVTDLPGYEQGWFIVQDEAAQLAAPLLEVMPQQRVLDACCAPGGKTSHLFELQPTISLTAIDKDAERIKLTQENLKRCGYDLSLQPADAMQIDTWWDQQLFDRILLDAPCSGSGVIAKHPDIKLLRQATDIIQYTKQQWQLLNTLWRCLKPGGLLLYVTCSILPQENHLLLVRFLAHNQRAKHIVIDAPWGKSCVVGRQILPGQNNMDGFYYALLQKLEA